MRGQPRDAPRVRLLTTGGTTEGRTETAARLGRAGLLVVPPHDRSAATVDLVVVRRDGAGSAAAAVSASCRRAQVPHLVMGGRTPGARELVGVVLAGARGWVGDDVSDDALAAAVKDLLAGHLSLPRDQVGPVVGELRRRSERTVRRADGRAVQLSTREWDVLSALAAGAGGAQVAAMLVVDQATVRGYVASAVRRLQAADRAEAVRLFLDEEDGIAG